MIPKVFSIFMSLGLLIVGMSEGKEWCVICSFIITYGLLFIVFLEWIGAHLDRVINRY